MPDAVLDPAVVDLDRVASWMDDRGLGEGPITDTSLIAGGAQNVLLRFRRGEREFVLRRPPPHKRANSDEPMRRGARVLGAAFYLMEPVEGFKCHARASRAARVGPATASGSSSKDPTHGRSPG